MSFYVIWVCFSFWSLAARCFYETLGEAFCLIRSVCTWYPFIHLLSSRDAHHEPYITAITAPPAMKSQTDWVCAFIWPRSCIYWPLSAVTQTKVENLHQPSKYGQNLAGDQPGWSLLDSLSGWNSDKSPGSSERGDQFSVLVASYTENISERSSSLSLRRRITPSKTSLHISSTGCCQGPSLFQLKQPILLFFFSP